MRQLLTPPELPAYISRQGIAKLASVSPSTVKNWQASGLLPAPAIRGSRIIRWDRQAILDWLAAGGPTKGGQQR